MIKIVKFILILFTASIVCSCNDDGQFFLDKDNSVSIPDDLKGVYAWSYSPIDSDTGYFPANTDYIFHIEFGNDDIIRFYRNKEEILDGKLFKSTYSVYIKAEDFTYSISIGNEGKYIMINDFPFNGTNYFFKADEHTWKPDLSYVEPFEGFYIAHWYSYVLNVLHGQPITYFEFYCMNKSDDYTPLIQFDKPVKVRFFPPDFKTLDGFTFKEDSITNVVHVPDLHDTGIADKYYYAVRSIE